MRPFVLLVVMDGWGISTSDVGNAINQASLPNMVGFIATYPNTQLEASGAAVGLPPHEPGNTETGHLNLGAGRIVYQDLERINRSIVDESFYKNKVLNDAITHARDNNSNLHFMGLIGGGGVHSNINHLFALIHLAKINNFDRVYLHLFTDGRDSPPASALTYINEIKEVIAKEGVGQIASISGRYYAMDRDNRIDRTELTYNALTKGTGHLYKTVDEAVNDSYSIGKQDEFIEPSLIEPMTLIKSNDSVVFFNFRVDRSIQLSNFLVNNSYFVMMTKYSQELQDKGAKIAFEPEIVSPNLGSVISENNLKQLRMAESEKERFVTFYFNGQRELPYEGEKRVIIPSPKVPTYDKKPEMSAYELTDALISELSNKENDYSFALVNYANADMVGHTGSIGATVTGVEVIDDCLGKLALFTLSNGGTMLVAADHGHAEQMIGSVTRDIETEHSSNPVPFIAVSKTFFGKPVALQTGILADVAPTVLKLLDLPVPSSMTGRNLLEGVA